MPEINYSAALPALPLMGNNAININAWMNSLGGSFLSTVLKLFSKGEQGYVYDFNDINTKKMTFRKNILTETEFTHGYADLDYWGGGVTPSTFSGLGEGTGFSVTKMGFSPAYKKVSNAVIGAEYTLSFFVRMNDGGAPSIDTYGGDPTGDFGIIVSGQIVDSSKARTFHQGNGLYRVTGTRVADGGQYFGLVKSGSNSSREFTVSGFQLEVGNTASEYQPITTGVTEFLTKYPQHSLFQDDLGAIPVTEVGQPVGLILDKSKNLKLGVELFSQVSSGLNASLSNTFLPTTVTCNSDTTVFGARIDGLLTANAHRVEFSWTGNTARKDIVLNTAAGQIKVGNAVSGSTSRTVFPKADSSIGIFQFEEPQVGQSFTLTSMSVKKILGNHAYQLTAALKPTLRFNALTNNYDLAFGTGAQLVGNLPMRLTGCTDIRAVQSEGTKVIYNATLEPSYIINSSFASILVINRSLTFVEKVLLVNSFDKLVGASSIDSEITKLFNTEQGFVYDFNDLSTMYQDAAGTIPVTAAEQPVGLVLDKSKGLVKGSEINTQSQILASQFPTGSSVNNFLISTTAIPNAFYSVEFTVTNYNNTGGDGSIGLDASTADARVRVNGNGVYKFITFLKQTSVTFFLRNNATADFSNIKIKQVFGNHAYQTVSAMRPLLKASPVSTPELLANSGFNTDTSSWTAYRSPIYSVSGGQLTISVSSETAGLYQDIPTEVGSTYSVNITKAGNVSLGVYGGAGFINTIITTFSTSFTFVATSTTTRIYIYCNVGNNGVVNEISVRNLIGYVIDKNYLAFDGVDDFLQTNNIDFTVTDKVSLFAGMRKLSDATTATVFELSTSKNINSGVFALFAPVDGGVTQMAWISKGVTERAAVNNTIAAPITTVISVKGSISGDVSTLKVNGTQVSNSLDQGAGNYGNYPLFIGRRGGASLPFNGHIYSLIGIGRLTTDTETLALEKAIAKLTGVALNV